MAAGATTDSVWLRVDLTGSNCGPGWFSVVLELAPTADFEVLRRGAAKHYDVPLKQVGPVLTERPEDWDDGWGDG